MLDLGSMQPRICLDLLLQDSLALILITEKAPRLSAKIVTEENVGGRLISMLDFVSQEGYDATRKTQG